LPQANGISSGIKNSEKGGMDSIMISHVQNMQNHFIQSLFKNVLIFLISCKLSPLLLILLLLLFLLYYFVLTTQSNNRSTSSGVVEEEKKKGRGRKIEMKEEGE